jgi:hypothetical protein
MSIDDAVLNLEDLANCSYVLPVHIKAVGIILARNKVLERALSATYKEVAKLGLIL